MRFVYYEVNKDVIESGLRELMMDYLNTAVRAGEGGDKSSAKRIMSEGYAVVAQIAKRREVDGLEGIEKDAETINKILESGHWK